MSTTSSVARKPRPGFRILTALAAVAMIAAIAPLAMPARADAATVATVRLSSYDAALLHDINAARTAHGRRPLVVAPGTTDVAHGWSCALRRAGALSHRPNLVTALVRHGSAAWRTLGENVGMSGSAYPSVLFSAYMHSPEHRANILDAGYHYVGIHTERANGVAWNTLDFVDAYSTSYGATRVTC